MKTFLLDLMHDLRAKKLLPVAVLLLAAIVAVPFVLSKSSEDPAPPTATPVVKDQAPDPDDLQALASVRLDEAAPTDASDLDTFDPSNPFRPPRSARPKDDVVEVTESTQIEETIDGGAGEQPSSGGGGESTPTQPPAPTTPPEEKTETVKYQYVIDATLVVNGRKRTLKGVQRLDMLPSQANPLILFLGVTADGGNGVFLIDSTLAAAGEGSCKPSADDCSQLYLGAGSEHQFTNEAGDSYDLRIDQIRKVKVNAKASGSRAKKRSARAGAAKGTTRRFVPALISDLESVTTTETDPSTPASDGR